ncbi:MAG: glutamine--fructose-6-phosphate transaminase (isomerizing) [Lactobacillus sp.]|jgi:glucosamine--fructose-6-phosphate aminotransferase (isomerizing)|nr:glutamine--fructose-6-phosphate transaminase (isomerizing) [Lactobacillus sp.]MCI1917968.1 glutamine--fructose-6-phosphate transaminase (isomerizing) [Lactobacillus sp.]MCI1941451.1 glutamine--fructose-6-phosphate transaminase (isomerizing) [Lactobacillus sp.]MCI1972038.1 glutamine--fructose-6-phosphate transaminase (isomerizing) [Lactobacillus sp.]MCI2016119.1 glutamine--fructose-6-phosphate transaminase (isomerizing) [Lactobacillus sp.]
MCGIVGVIGREDASTVLLHGLSKLEYRGYDSAGLYVNGAGQDYLVKRVGRIQALKDAVGPEVQGTMGIGHTRWATNGEPTVANAHPHQSQDGRFYLVHNGVITNAAKLKQTYLQNVTLASQTDTEVVVQLIALFAQDGLSAKAALRKTLSLLEGSYAFALADRTAPDILYAAKKQSPLLVGLGNGFNVIASDAMAMIDQTHQFLELNDGELVTLTAQAVTIEDAAGTPVKRDPVTIELDAQETEKGAYPYYMLKEVSEQPAVMRRLLRRYTKGASLQFDVKLLAALKDADQLYIVAAGTSYHAGLVGQALFEQLAGVRTTAFLASEFAYHQPLLSQKPFFIFLTQSGETADLRQVLVQINAKNLPSLTMTNVLTATLAREATFALDLAAGPEIAVASTKAYTAQVALEALLAKALGAAKGQAAAKAFDVEHELSLAATGQQALIDQQSAIHELAKEMFATTRNAFFIGRGTDYYVSLESALKLKEISYVQAEGFAAGELKHGTIALIEPGTPVVAIITDPTTAARTRSNAEEVEARGGKVLRIVAESLAEPGDDLIVPALNPLLSPLLTIVPAQLLAYYTSLDRGYDVDRPRNLAKSVTVE